MIRKAEKEDIAPVADHYRELFAYEAVHSSQTNWVPGLYPTERTARAALEEGTLYVLEEEKKLCGSMILNRIQPPEYGSIDWRYAAEEQEIIVVHTLCIPPSQKGKGYGRQFLGFVLQYAAECGCKAVRLDTWAENHPAAALYRKLGFRFAGTAPMYLQGAIPEQQIFFEKEVVKK